MAWRDARIPVEFHAFIDLQNRYTISSVAPTCVAIETPCRPRPIVDPCDEEGVRGGEVREICEGNVG